MTGYQLLALAVVLLCFAQLGQCMQLVRVADSLHAIEAKCKAR
jgi:hypothetical protein